MLPSGTDYFEPRQLLYKPAVYFDGLMSFMQTVPEKNTIFPLAGAAEKAPIHRILDPAAELYSGGKDEYDQMKEQAKLQVQLTNTDKVKRKTALP